MYPGTRVRNIAGRTFGRWTVVRYVGKAPSGQHMWLCRCECSREVEVQSGNLLNGRSTQCRWCSNRDAAARSAERRRLTEEARRERRKKLPAAPVWSADGRRVVSRLLGGYLRSLRKDKGLSQGDLGSAMNITKSAVSYYECGRSSIPVPVLLVWCVALGVDPADVVSTLVGLCEEAERSAASPSHV
jgi:ribosome-binding protein aMBF1 (putative translation factor)